MNLLEKGAKYLDRMRTNRLTVSVLYLNYQVQATVGKTVFKIDSGYGVTYVESTDFLISTDALKAEPKKRDVIEWRGGKYEVLAPDSEPVWRYSDPYQTTYRIHTKKVN